MSKAGASKHVEMQGFSRPKAITTGFSAATDKGSPTASPPQDQKAPSSPPSPLLLEILLGGSGLFTVDPEQKIEQDLKGALAAPGADKAQRLATVFEGIIVNKQFPLLVKLYYQNPQTAEFVNAAAKFGYKADNDRDKDQSDKLFGFWVKVLGRQAVKLQRHRVDECFYDNKNAKPPVERHPFDMLLGFYCYTENYSRHSIATYIRSAILRLEQSKFKEANESLTSILPKLTGENLKWVTGLVAEIADVIKTAFDPEKLKIWIQQLTTLWIKQLQECRPIFAKGVAVLDFNCIEILNRYDMDIMLKMRELSLQQLTPQIIRSFIDAMFTVEEAQAQVSAFEKAKLPLNNQMVQLFETLQDRSLARARAVLPHYWGLGYLLLSKVHDQLSRFHRGQILIQLEDGKNSFLDKAVNDKHECLQSLIEQRCLQRQFALYALWVAESLLADNNCSNLVANVYPNAGGLANASCFDAVCPTIGDLVTYHSNALRDAEKVADRIPVLRVDAAAEAEAYLAVMNPSFATKFISFS